MFKLQIIATIIAAVTQAASLDAMSYATFQQCNDDGTWNGTTVTLDLKSVQMENWHRFVLALVETGFTVANAQPRGTIEKDSLTSKPANQSAHETYFIHLEVTSHSIKCLLFIFVSLHLSCWAFSIFNYSLTQI